MAQINETHAPDLKSWVVSANRTGCDFPIQNLPFAIFRRKATGETYRAGIAIGDQILDLAALDSSGLLDGDAGIGVSACNNDTLNRFMATGPRIWSALRYALSRALRAGSGWEQQLRDMLVPQTEAEYQLPATIGDYTDFYTSIYHATSVGKLFRPDNPLLPNYKWVPIGYHGRSSSIAVSGQSFHRPIGQTKAADAATPSVGPCKRLDYELELGIYIGAGNPLGQPIAIDDSDGHVFGLCLFNDWSARDIQAWEYQPLGPFLSKSFASTVSPWIITLEALTPFRTSWHRDPADPQPLAYLESTANRSAGALDIELEVLLQTSRMRDADKAPHSLSHSNYKHAYWTVAQMVAHHTINGCNLRPGDLFGSGTQSGPGITEAGSLLELSQGGTKAVELPNGESRTFLHDGDSVIMRGWCDKPGAVRIGFGEVVGTVLPAKNRPEAD